jgi:hypothetical protein
MKTYAKKRRQGKRQRKTHRGGNLLSDYINPAMTAVGTSAMPYVDRATGVIAPYTSQLANFAYTHPYLTAAAPLVLGAAGYGTYKFAKG